MNCLWLRCQAFSIDDSATTEIDDALSVQGLGSGTLVFGVHIAAPALAITPDTPLDKLARHRLSTVYMPGWKLTMLPDEVVQTYTLTAGRDCPAVSLYVTLDESHARGAQTAQTRLERVPIVSNLRHDKLDSVITEATLSWRGPRRLPARGRARLCVAPGPRTEGAARGGARQARDLQPA